MARVLVIEDNHNLALGLRTNLEFEGHEADIAGDGTSGMIRARTRSYDLLVLDLMLPALDGFKVLETLRAEGVTTPVLVLTARGDEEDKVRGLRGGADDYVTKPFALRELLARIEALLRRSRPSPEGPARGGGLAFRRRRGESQHQGGDSRRPRGLAAAEGVRSARRAAPARRRRGAPLRAVAGGLGLSRKRARAARSIPTSASCAASWRPIPRSRRHILTVTEDGVSAGRGPASRAERGGEESNVNDREHSETRNESARR